MADTYTVERSVRVDASPERVYAEVADFHRWRDWSPWEGLDPAMERTHSGASSGTGAVYAWSGNRRAGQGRMEVVEATAPSRVRIDVRFDKPFRSRTETVIAIAPDGRGSRVTWTMTGPMTLMTRAMSLVRSMDAMIGPDFERGLAQLKAVTEPPPSV